MRIGGGGSDNANVLQSDNVTYRNQDAEVDAGRCFYDTQLQGAVVAEFAHIQLWNPAGSARIVLLDDFYFGVQGTVLARVGVFNTELTGISTVGFNKINGGTAALAGTRIQSNATVLGSLRQSFRMTSSNSMRVVFRNPLRLAAGEGFLLLSSTVNIFITIVFNWREYTV